MGRRDGRKDPQGGERGPGRDARLGAPVTTAVYTAKGALRPDAVSPFRIGTRAYTLLLQERPAATSPKEVGEVCAQV